MLSVLRWQREIDVGGRAVPRVNDDETQELGCRSQWGKQVSQGYESNKVAKAGLVVSPKTNEWKKSSCYRQRFVEDAEGTRSRLWEVHQGRPRQSQSGRAQPHERHPLEIGQHHYQRASIEL